MDIFNIFILVLVQNGPLFFLKAGVQALLPPQNSMIVWHRIPDRLHWIDKEFEYF